VFQTGLRFVMQLWSRGQYYQQPCSDLVGAMLGIRLAISCWHLYTKAKQARKDCKAELPPEAKRQTAAVSKEKRSEGFSARAPQSCQPGEL